MKEHTPFIGSPGRGILAVDIDNRELQELLLSSVDASASLPRSSLSLTSVVNEHAAFIGSPGCGILAVDVGSRELEDLLLSSVGAMQYFSAVTLTQEGLVHKGAFFKEHNILCGTELSIGAMSVELLDFHCAMYYKAGARFLTCRADFPMGLTDESILERAQK